MTAGVRKIRVLIVEDSNVVRELLEYTIRRDPRLEVAGAVASAEEALRLLHRIAPDVISMDIRLPGMNGFEATQRIMAEKPTPIVVLAASVDSDDLKITVNALQAGALTVLEKPVGPNSAEYKGLAQRLCTQLAIMSQVRVVRQRTALTSRLVPAVRPSAKCGGNYQMMGIVSSTGGPNAIAQLLGCLGDDFPLPILLVQHIGPKFLDGFAVWLRSISSFRVKVVETRECVLPGTIYLASQDRHLRAGRDYVETNDGDRVSLQRPSGTVLFESMASSLGGEALGVLLTGMGDDGAAGLLRIWQEGGHTIAEDESTAVVYGMPSEAVRLGGVSESLPLHAIAPRVLDLVHVAKSKI